MYRVMLVVMAVACALGGTAWMGPAAANPPAMKVNGKDGAEMVLIPAGEFLAGTSEEELEAVAGTCAGQSGGQVTRRVCLPGAAPGEGNRVAIIRLPSGPNR